MQDGRISMVERNTKVKLQLDSTFIPYENLTENKVLNWVWKKIANVIKGGGGNPDVAVLGKEAIEKKVQADIDILLNPPVIYPPLPWG